MDTRQFSNPKYEESEAHLWKDRDTAKNVRYIPGAVPAWTVTMINLETLTADAKQRHGEQNEEARDDV